MAMTSTAQSAPQGSSIRTGRFDRLFYGGMAAALALTVFAGFASSYYLRILTGGPQATLSGGPFTPLVHAHAALFTAWVLLFVVQTALVASHRVALHRRIGVAGAALAASMIVVGTATAIATAARGSAPAGVDPLAFLMIPLSDMALFAGFVGAALAFRRNREAHKRLMLLAYVSIIVAAVARLPGVLPLGPLGFFGLSLLFVAAGAVYDYVSRDRVHRVYLWGGAVLIVAIPLRLALSGTSAWRSVAEALTR
jgi:uncharacterized membrane protein